MVDDDMRGGEGLREGVGEEGGRREPAAHQAVQPRRVEAHALLRDLHEALIARGHRREEAKRFQRGGHRWVVKMRVGNDDDDDINDEK